MILTAVEGGWLAYGHQAIKKKMVPGSLTPTSSSGEAEEQIPGVCWPAKLRFPPQHTHHQYGGILTEVDVVRAREFKQINRLCETPYWALSMQR